MNKKQMLKKSIEKAFKGGWDKEQDWFPDRQFTILKITDENEIVTIQTKSGVGLFALNNLIFGHGFCKGFFGKHKVCSECGSIPERTWDEKAYFCYECRQEVDRVPAWIYRGIKMFISTNRLKYLSKFLEKK